VSREQRAPFAFFCIANEEMDMTVVQVVYDGRPIFQPDGGVCDPSNRCMNHPEMDVDM